MRTTHHRAMDMLLQNVHLYIDSYTVKTLDVLFDITELRYALTQLGNEKTLRLDCLSKEFMLHFWKDLGELVTDIINEIWRNQHMDPCLKRGIIKFLHKQTFYISLSHWHPITMLGILYEILAKAIALRLSPHLRKHIHTSQSGFIGGHQLWKIFSGFSQALNMLTLLNRR